ncbi:signal recognition particle 19 kDa protein-like isoform X2 [Ptychodera flava]|uniref:signal recognition particle 19 kDa protein-like isoform X2 n=1 Tax=Ptychodera flava TaxID=63121 RepID=UPI003969EE60
MAAHQENPGKPRLTLEQAKKEKWICLYPAYINSKKTLAEGRRIPKSKAVEHPTVQEMKDVLLASGIQLGLENKMYPRDPNRDVQSRGRLRIKMLKEDGSHLYENEHFHSKKSMLLYLCETIPKLKTRTQKQSGADSGGQGQGQGKKKKKGKR